MRSELKLRVSPEMKKLIESTQIYYDKKGIKITKVEATRIIAKKADPVPIYREKKHRRGFNLEI